MAATLSRRSVLIGALGVALSGCALLRPAKAPGAASAACRTVTTLPIFTPVANDKQAAAFEAFDPVLYPLSSSEQYSGPAKAQWAIVQSGGWNPPIQHYALDVAVQAANLDPASLLPGTAAAFRYQGSTWALPGSVQPLAISYRPDVFAAAQLPEPAADWSVADFENACLRILGLTRAGKIPGCYGPLAPLVGSSTITATEGGNTFSHPVYGDLRDAAVWTGFAAGYGGFLTHAGGFDLTNPGAAAGLGELVRIARAYGAPEKLLPSTAAQQQTYLDGAAMLFRPYGGTPVTPSGAAGGVRRKYARFPVLPVQPAVPATLSGWRLASTLSVPPAAPPAAALDSVVQFALWTWRGVRDNPAAPGPPPVLADPQIQRGYWEAATQVASGATAVGDYTHYVYVDQDFPPVFADTAGIVYDALSGAVTGTADVAAALSAATQRLNAAAAQYMTDKQLQAQAALGRASTYGVFGAAVAPPPTPAGPVVRVCAK